MAVALFAALIAAVSLLFFFKDYLRSARQRMPERIAAGLRPELLKARTEVPRFDLIEDSARRLKEDFPSLAQVFITKLRPDSVECCIYPWNRREQPPEGLPSIKIEQDGVVLGYLYYRLDQRRAMLFEGIVNALIPLLILAAFAMAFHVWRQDRALATTRVQLVEKNRELAHLERLSLAGQLAANLLPDLKKARFCISGTNSRRGKLRPIRGRCASRSISFFRCCARQTWRTWPRPRTNARNSWTWKKFFAPRSIW
jgi:hypothetical protein